MNRRSAALLLLMILVAACAESTSGRSVDELRERLERTRCRNRMDSLVFTVKGLLLDVEEPDGGSVDSVVASLGDSLASCPSSNLRYQVTLEDNSLRVECPAGHGGRRADLL